MGVPSISYNPSAASSHQYQEALNESATLIFAGRGNLYGFYVEETGGADIYIQFFDAADPGDVTVGSTAPDFTFRVPANGAMGKDVNDSPLHFFQKGCVVAVTADRTGATPPAADAAAQFWFVNRQP